MVTITTRTIFFFRTLWPFAEVANSSKMIVDMEGGFWSEEKLIKRDDLKAYIHKQLEFHLCIQKMLHGAKS